MNNTISTNDIFFKMINLSWRVMDDIDKSSFAGIVSDNPMIADDGDFVYILDNTNLQVMNLHDNFAIFQTFIVAELQ